MNYIENHDWSRIVSDLYIRVDAGYAIYDPAREQPIDTMIRAGYGLRTAQREGGMLEQVSADVARRLRGEKIQDPYSQIPEEILKDLFS